MEKWFLTRKGADFQEISQKFHVSPVIARLIRNRDVIGDSEIECYLHGNMESLYDGILMKDMAVAVDILREKIQDKKPIRIIGDYDIDGVNATYILLEGIEKLGGNVSVDIPDRMKDGYGLNKSLIDRAFESGVDTIITCDNGIAAREEIAYGKSLGMTIIVTDHHEVPYEETNEGLHYLFPPADAIVDPKREDCEYPFPHLCGAGVAYKLVETLFNVEGKETTEIEYLVENVAIATVGDVMDLTGENRIFVKYGLEKIKQTKNLGLKALMECTGIDVGRLSSYHIGFVIGPCLNASGRLDTAKRALKLLRAKTKADAEQLAGDLKALNDNRKELTTEAVEEAIMQVENTILKEDKVLVIYLPNCHESLAGIVAGRIREKYYRPTFVLTNAEKGAKGSGRSIETYHMYDEMIKCKDLLGKFGGHKLAGGLSIPIENIDMFRRRLNENCQLSAEDLYEKISIDMQLPLAYVSESLIGELECLEPFGKANPKPVFAEKDIRVKETRILGKNNNVLKLHLVDVYGTMIEGMYFGDVESFMEMVEKKKGKINITYYPTINEYRGRKTVQIVIQNYQ
ncbi:single-stranded-DNA-specific exonuclease RecJ [Faecalimonas sp.]